MCQIGTLQKRVVCPFLLQSQKSNKTAMMEFFDDIYVALSDIFVVAAIAAVGIGVGWVFQYRDFDNMKPLTFDGVQDPIIAMRWLSDVEGCFFKFSCPAD